MAQDANTSVKTVTARVVAVSESGKSYSLVITRKINEFITQEDRGYVLATPDAPVLKVGATVDVPADYTIDPSTSKDGKVFSWITFG